MGVILKNLKKGVRDVKRLSMEQAAEQHAWFTGEVLRAAKDIARADAFDTGKFHDSLGMKGTPGKIMQVGSTDRKPKVLVIENGSEARGKSPKYVMGRSVGLAFDRTKVKAKGFKVLKGVVSAV